MICPFHVFVRVAVVLVVAKVLYDTYNDYQQKRKDTPKVEDDESKKQDDVTKAK